MPRANRANYDALFESLGIEPSGQGLQIADGLQPVLDLSGAAFRRRNVFGVTMNLGAAGVGLFNELSLVTSAPTKIHHLSFNSSTNFTLGTFGVGDTGSAVVATPLTPQQLYGSSAPPRNVVGHDQVGVLISFSLGITEGQGTTPWVAFVPHDGFTMGANQRLRLADPTPNASTIFQIIWEEQTGGNVAA